MAFTFEGFDPANTTPVPDVFFDVLLSQLTGAEVKVLLYIIRRTTGFKKTTDTISFTQFEKGIITKEKKVLDTGTGLSRETISKALIGLEAKGCIKSHKRTSASGDKDTSAYSVRFKGEVVGKSDHPTWSEKTTTLVGKSDHGSQKSGLPVVGKSDIQLDSNTRNSTQETVIQESTIVATSAEDRNAPAANVHDIEIMRQRKTDPRIPAVSSHSHADIGNEETVKMAAVKKGQTDATLPHSSNYRHTDTDVRGVSGSGDALHASETVASQQTPAAGAALPPSSSASVQATSLISNSTPEQRSGASLAGIPASPGAAQVRQVIPKRPLRKVIEKPQLTFGGQQVREWYEQARECKVRMTDKNVITLNRLADIDEMTQENLKDVLELYDTDKWLIEHNVTVDLQELEKQDGKFTFERGLLAVKRKRRAKGPASNISKNGTDLNQYGLQALLQRQEQKAV